MAPAKGKGKATRAASPAKARSPDGHKKRVNRQKAKAPAASQGASTDSQRPVEEDQVPFEDDSLDRVRANAEELLALERAAAVAAAEAATAFRLSEEEEMAQAFAEFYSTEKRKDWARPLDGRPSDPLGIIACSVPSSKPKKQDDLQARDDITQMRDAAKKAQGELSPSPLAGHGKAARTRREMRASSPRTAAVMEASARIAAAKSAAKAASGCAAAASLGAGPNVAEVRVAVPPSVAVSTAPGGSNQQNPEQLPPPVAASDMACRSDEWR